MPDRKPNIIWIMLDDLSWADIGCYGQTLIATPHIDRLAAEGMRFTHCYSGSPVCAPSRSCLTQGLHSGHTSVRDNMRRFNAAGEQYRASLLPGDITVAQVLKDAGYATGLFGKWGLSTYDQPGLPNDMGFDEFFGYLNQRQAHSYYPEFLWHNTERVHFPGNVGHNCRKPNAYDADGRIIPNGIADPAQARYAFDEYAARGLDFVRRHKDEPFFLYLAYTTPHGVEEVPELGEYKDRDWPLLHKVHAAMVTRTDAAVGELMALLKELAIDEDTLVFFVSDNGYSYDGQPRGEVQSFDDVFQHSGPWKGIKGLVDQGGLRVPALARWPGKIAPQSVSDQPWAFWDFLPTAAEVAGAACPPTDGLSILPTLLGDRAAQAQHEYLYWEYRDMQAARLGTWWAIRNHPSQPVALYDADVDVQQQYDLSCLYPAVVARVEQLFREQHVPCLQTPSPGESQEAWVGRAAAAGIRLMNNTETY